MNPYQLTQEADRDIGEILDYVARRSGLNPALKLADELDSAMALIARRSTMGHRREDLTQDDVWFYRVHSILIVYQKTRPVKIVRVLHGSRDVAAELSRD